MFGTDDPCPKIPSSTWNRKQHFQLDMPQCGPENDHKFLLPDPAPTSAVRPCAMPTVGKPQTSISHVSAMAFFWAAQTLDGIMRASLWQLVLMEILSKPKHQQTPLLEEFSGPRFVIGNRCSNGHPGSAWNTLPRLTTKSNPPRALPNWESPQLFWMPEKVCLSPFSGP